MKQKIMDFSVETGFQERLLKKIKQECFCAISDDDLQFVNAAGVPGLNQDQGNRMAKLEEME